MFRLSYNSKYRYPPNIEDITQPRRTTFNYANTECTLKIANVSEQEHFGKWICFLSKTNGNQDLWREMTNYNVKLFAPMKLQITVSSYKLNNIEDDVNDKNLLQIHVKVLKIEDTKHI